jgi:peptidoglycan/LPS O-acetylase OafA/YrhL
MRKSFSSFLEKFRRITTGTDYMPEIDGLRFIAICWVAVLMHLTNIINTNLYNGELITNTTISKIVLEGGHGVDFFFMISGFILALPFLKEKQYNGKKVSLKKYFLRRLTRLEPPYIAALLIAFILLVFVIKKYSFSDLSGNLLASLFYLHNLIFDQRSAVLEVAWSLEVEVQFYILAPFLSLLFLIRPNLFRWFVLLFLIILSSIKHWLDLWNPSSSFIDFACYFLIGMLLADLYCSKWRIVKNRKVCTGAGILIFTGLHFVFSVEAIGWYFMKMLLMTVFFYIAITNEWWKKLLRVQWISVIGGMCYSIYLLHLLVMAAVTKVLVKFPIENKVLGFFVFGIIILTVVLVVCMVFYRFIEQPCMKKDWYKYIFKKRMAARTNS